MSESTSTTDAMARALTTDIVSAYVASNPLPAGELSGLIASVHRSIVGLASGLPDTVEVVSEDASPAQIRKSVRPEALISFIDGKPYKTLKRHLTKHGLDPASYRQRFGLPSDYPMVCVSYSATRSDLAKTLGLGQRVPAAKPAPKASRRQDRQAAE